MGANLGTILTALGQLHGNCEDRLGCGNMETVAPIALNASV